MKENKTIYFLVPFITFLVVVLILLLIYFRVPAFLFSKASGYDVTGKWQTTINLTSPQNVTLRGIANLTQDSNGRVTGTATSTDGSNPQSITGKVTGNQFVSDPINFSGTQTGIQYAGSYVITGTISENSSYMSGSVSGNITKPYNSPLAGPFTANKISGSQPTTETTITPTATSSVIKMNTPTPASTIAFLSPIPGYTNPPIPVTGSGFPVKISLFASLFFLSIAATFLF